MGQLQSPAVPSPARKSPRGQILAFHTIQIPIISNTTQLQLPKVRVRGVLTFYFIRIKQIIKTQNICIHAIIGKPALSFGEGRTIMLSCVRTAALLLLGICVSADTPSFDSTAQPTWGEGAPLAPPNPECAIMNLILKSNTTSERCRACYSTINCAFCIAHERGNPPFSAPQCLQLRDLGTDEHCSIAQAWFPGRQYWAGNFNQLPNGKSKNSYGPGAVHEDIRFCDDIYAPLNRFTKAAIVFMIVGAILCPFIACLGYCCNFYKSCPLAPPEVSSKYKYEIENFFNSGSKYGFPGTDGSLMSNYWQYIYNQDEFISILYAHPLNPYGRLKRAIGLATLIMWKCTFLLILCVGCNGKPDAVAIFVGAYLISLFTIPVKLLLEECARARILHKIGCGVWLAERLSSIFMAILFSIAFFLYGTAFNGRPQSNFSSGAVVLSILQSWIFKHIILRLNFTTINSWKGSSLCLPHLRQASSDQAGNGIGEELEQVKTPTFSIFSCSPVAFVFKSVLYGIGDSTFLEDKKKFFDEKGPVRSIDVCLQQFCNGEIDSRRKSGLARPSQSGIELFANSTTRNSLHSHSKRLSNGQLATI